MAKVTPQSEIEEFAEEGFLLLAVGLVTVLGMRFAVVLPRGCRRGRRGCRRGAAAIDDLVELAARSEEHTSELQSLMRISYAVLCLKKKKRQVIKDNVIQRTEHR